MDVPRSHTNPPYDLFCHFTHSAVAILLPNNALQSKSPRLWFLLVLFVFLVFFLFLDVSVEFMSIVSLVGGSRATPRPSGVITAVIGATFGVGGGSLPVGAGRAKDNLVCF